MAVSGMQEYRLTVKSISLESVVVAVVMSVRMVMGVVNIQKNVGKGQVMPITSGKEVIELWTKKFPIQRSYMSDHGVEYLEELIDTALHQTMEISASEYLLIAKKLAREL